MPPSARTSASSSAPSSATSPVLLDVLTTDDLLDLALSFCTEDAMRAAYASCRAFRAAAVPHLRRLLSIALVGKTPENKQAGRLGVFLKREGLVNGFASYAKAGDDGDDGAMLWHAAGCWQVGPAANLGQVRGWVSLRDGCLRPEASTVTWKVYDGTAWVVAPELRCLAGDALATEIAKAAPQIALVGQTPQNKQAGVLGVFLKREGLVNGYPSYAKEGDDGGMLWHAAACWQVGPAANLGQNRGRVSVIDGCLRPEASCHTWRVYNGAAWIDAPELRCLAGDALADEITKAAPQIALVGPTPQNKQAGVLGVYVKRTALVNGFASYAKAGDDGAMLWHAGRSWYLGPAANLGQVRGCVSVMDGCLRPEASTVTWRVYDGTAFVDAPGLRCLAGDALAAEFAKAAPQIALVGPTPQNKQAGVLGVFLKRDELVNGYPSYTKTGDEGIMLWHAESNWLIGAAAKLGQDHGRVGLRDGCLRPEASSATWRVYDGGAWVDAPELRCLAGRPSSSRRIWDRKEGRWLDTDSLDYFEDARA